MLLGDQVAEDLDWTWVSAASTFITFLRLRASYLLSCCLAWHWSSFEAIDGPKGEVRYAGAWGPSLLLPTRIVTML